MSFVHHVLTRTIVLPEQRVLFVPVPKAGCTTILWTLARLAGMTEADFAGSLTPEVSPALTVHDVERWEPHLRFDRLDAGERERILADPSWLRFSLVRHPATRLWSAWQSKLLLREPRFVAQFGDEPWFPRLPEDTEQVVEDFRRFVGAIAGGATDVHWAVQRELVEQLPLTHVGRVETLEQTLALLGHHAGPLPPALHENRTPLPLPAGAFDARAGAALEQVYAADFAAYGYDPAEPAGGQEDWAPLLPLLRAAIGDHARFADVHRAARRLERRVHVAERTAAVAETRRGTATGARVLTNREDEADFTVRWGWADGDLEPGFTAVLRAKDEARVLPYALPPLLRAVQRVVLIDNGSTDGTVGVARSVAAACGAADRLDVYRYPFAVARCGADHLATPADSVHSLAYFYNWCFSHVRTTYALKWDGDMVLSDEAVQTLRDLAWQLEACEAVVKIPRTSLYLADGGHGFLDTELRNCEPWAWPNRRGYSFVKAMEWELPLWGPGAQTFVLPEGACVELKFLDADEFDHWTDADFKRSERTQRKRREYEVFTALTAGGPPPPGVVELRGDDVVAQALLLPA